MITIFEYLWWRDRMTILRLLCLHLLDGHFVEAVVQEPLPRVDAPGEYERLMRHAAYRRARGGALRQVRQG